MTLAESANGPVWIIYVVAAIFILISILLLSGRGSWFIAGYNTASKEEKEKYNEKKLCRVVGSGMAFIAVVCVVIAIFANRIPAAFSNVILILILLDVAIILVLSGTICKNKR